MRNRAEVHMTERVNAEESTVERDATCLPSVILLLICLVRREGKSNKKRDFQENWSTSGESVNKKRKRTLDSEPERGDFKKLSKDKT